MSIIPTLDIKDDYKEINYYYLEDKYKSLAGKVLTIIDASIPNAQQNKCVKDLIKTEFRNRIDELQKFYWNEKKGHSVKFEEEN